MALNHVEYARHKENNTCCLHLYHASLLSQRLLNNCFLSYACQAVSITKPFFTIGFYKALAVTNAVHKVDNWLGKNASLEYFLRLLLHVFWPVCWARQSISYHLRQLHSLSVQCNCRKRRLSAAEALIVKLAVSTLFDQLKWQIYNLMKLFHAFPSL